VTANIDFLKPAQMSAMLAQNLLADAVNDAQGCIPLSWVRSSNNLKLCNLGDAASAVIVASISGRKVAPRAFNSKFRRMVGVGTIGQGQSAGAIHVWGTGFDPNRAPIEPKNRSFEPAPGVEYNIHAVRGPYSRAILLKHGIPTPAIYGDPAWFLPRIFNPEREIKHELGVISHISELASPRVTAEMRDDIRRYSGGVEEGVHFISTYHEPSWQGFQDKLTEMLSCRRIISRSFHGMLLADAYRIPCLYLSGETKGAQVFPIEAGFDHVDRRFADAYRGMGRTRLQGFGLPIGEESPWGEVIKAADKLWEPISFSGEALFEAFPSEAAVSFWDARWEVSEGLLAELPW
jgi:pyruvyltransferase